MHLCSKRIRKRGRQSRLEEKTPGTNATLDLCDQRRDLKKKRGEVEGVKDYKDHWEDQERKEEKLAKMSLIEGQCQRVEASLSKRQNKGKNTRWSKT